MQETPRRQEEIIDERIDDVNKARAMAEAEDPHREASKELFDIADEFSKLLFNLKSDEARGRWVSKLFDLTQELRKDAFESRSFDAGYAARVAAEEYDEKKSEHPATKE